MQQKEFLKKEIFNRFDAITRARNCFLYTKKGVRLTDLCQDGGSAILGWGSSKASLILKNVFNRGLTGFFHTEFEQNIQKATSKLFKSERKVFIFSSKNLALKAALNFSKESTSFYSPWLSENTDFSKIDCIVFKVPFTWENFFILAVKNQIATKENESFQDVSICAPLKAAIARAIYDLIAELPNRTEKDWFIYDKIITKYWQRKGPYLFPKVPEEKYNDFILHCLDCNLVISPDYQTPSIVPFKADLGNFSKLKNNIFKF